MVTAAAQDTLTTPLKEHRHSDVWGPGLNYNQLVGSALTLLMGGDCKRKNSTGSTCAKALEASDRVEQQSNPFAQTYGHCLQGSLVSYWPLASAAAVIVAQVYEPLRPNPSP